MTKIYLIPLLISSLFTPTLQTSEFTKEELIEIKENIELKKEETIEEEKETEKLITFHFDDLENDYHPTYTHSSDILNKAQEITDYVYKNHFSYGNAPINPGKNHDAKLISCDRLIAWLLYDFGYTDQPIEGLTCNNLDDYCEEKGFIKITDRNELQAGDFIFYSRTGNSQNISHVFILGDKGSNGLWYRYDCGSNERINLTGQYSAYTSQPFLEDISSQFMFAYRMTI